MCYCLPLHDPVCSCPGLCRVSPPEWIRPPESFLKGLLVFRTFIHSTHYSTFPFPGPCSLSNHYRHHPPSSRPSLLLCFGLSLTPSLLHGGFWIPLCLTCVRSTTPVRFPPLKLDSCHPRPPVGSRFQSECESSKWNRWSRVSLTTLDSVLLPSSLGPFLRSRPRSSVVYHRTCVPPHPCSLHISSSYRNPLINYPEPPPEPPLPLQSLLKVHRRLSSPKFKDKTVTSLHISLNPTYKDSSRFDWFIR